jgi:ABC-type branched-subunit amino acid transport system ATPase component
MPEPISITSEVDRIRASSSSAHRYAVSAGARTEQDRERMALAILRLNALVSMCAELSRELSALEREALDIAVILAT